jgi:hypothetical protein
MTGRDMVKRRRHLENPARQLAVRSGRAQAKGVREIHSLLCLDMIDFQSNPGLGD